MNVIEGLAKYLESCPLFGANAKVWLDYVPEKVGGLGLFAMDSKVLRQYMDGTCLLQGDYLLLVRGVVSEEAQRKKYNCLLEDIVAWLLRTGKDKRLPDFAPFAKVISASGSSPELKSVGNNGMGLYQLQLRLVYALNG